MRIRRHLRHRQPQHQQHHTSTTTAGFCFIYFEVYSYKADKTALVWFLGRYILPGSVNQGSQNGYDSRCTKYDTRYHISYHVFTYRQEEATLYWSGGVWFGDFAGQNRTTTAVADACGQLAEAWRLVPFCLWSLGSIHVCCWRE